MTTVLDTGTHRNTPPGASLGPGRELQSCWSDNQSNCKKWLPLLPLARTWLNFSTTPEGCKQGESSHSFTSRFIEQLIDSILLMTWSPGYQSNMSGNHRLLVALLFLGEQNLTVENRKSQCLFIELKNTTMCVKQLSGNKSFMFFFFSF